MSDAPSAKGRSSSKTAVWLIVAVALLFVIGANAHLVYVAVISQPACVAHLRPGESDAERGAFSAAQSNCSPQPTGGEQTSQ